MLGSVNPHSRKNGSYFLTFKHSTADDYYSEAFTVTEYGTSAKAKAAAEARRKELQPKFKKISNNRTGKSYVDKLYKKNPAFKKFIKEYSQNTDQPRFKNFYKLSGDEKIRLDISFKKNSKLPPKKGYNITVSQMAEKLGLTTKRLQLLGKAERLGKYINTKFESIKQSIPGKIGVVRIFKDPTDLQIKNYFENFSSNQNALPERVTKRIKDIDNVFRKTIINGKIFTNAKGFKTTQYLPTILEVIDKVDSINTPSEAVSAMSNYAKILRGSGLQQDLNIKEDIVAGERLLSKFGVDSRNGYKGAFYKAALSEVNQKNYNNRGTLTDFRARFNEELRNAMGLDKRLSNNTLPKLPYNINEVISLSAGKSRDIQPFSVFVDATDAKINQSQLANYQGVFSRKLGKVEDLIKAGKMPEATKLAATLKGSQEKTAANLLEKGFSQKQINQLNFPEIVVGDKVDPKIYSPENLAKYKEAGVDIEGFAKDRKFYIDTKGTKPFFEVGDQALKAVAIKLAKNNTGDICNLVTQNVAGGGRIGFAKGGNCATQVAAKFDEDPVKFAQDVNKLPEASGAINKAKSAASKFLSVAKKGGRFGAFAAAGAAAAGLVKEFRNDDPSTYLSSEGQQKNMLIDMVTQPVSTPTETPSTAFGDAQLPAIGAVTAAGMIPGGAELYKQRTGAGSMKRPLGGPRLDAEGAKILKNRVSPFRALTGPLSGVFGKGLAATGTPLGMLALEPLYIGQQIADGDSAGEIATNPLNYLGPAFAGALSKESTRFVPKTISSIMRLGISPMALKGVSRFGLAGLGLSAGVSAYEMYQNKKAGRGLFDDG